MTRWLAWFCLWLLIPLARAQESSETMLVLELRVTQSHAGSATVDRGSLDGLALGDRIRFAPRDGAALEGSVRSVEERSSVVSLDDPRASLALGTRGEARLPAARTKPSAPEKRRERRAKTEHEPWRNQDEGYTRKQPLLAKVKPLRPEERPATMRGRWYAGADWLSNSENDARDGFLRLGTDWTADNLFGGGEELRFDGELDWRRTEVFDGNDDERTRGRVDRLSYSHGGTRFEPSRVTLGRFLQSGMPEFGLLDGAEWTTRFDDGDRCGASVGFQPVPDAEQSTGDDLQAAAFYRWASDESERSTLACGYQKSFHELAADRDLLVVDVRHFPDAPWHAIATAWLDYYTSGDRQKDEGLDATQVLGNVGRRWGDDVALDLRYAHFELPEVERSELTPVNPNELRRARADRVALDLRCSLTADAEGWGRFGAWSDEADHGTDFEVGSRVADLAFEALFVELAAFGSEGRFSTDLGGRVALGRSDADGAWIVEYELIEQRIHDFGGSNNDLPTHRARVSRDWSAPGEWNLSIRGEASLWDEEHAFAAGLFLQRSY